MSTPRSLGYAMPAEWHPHVATLLAWPSNPETWPGERLHRVERVYLQLLEALTAHETVILIVGSLELRQRVENLLIGTRITRANLQLWDIPNNDVWARDFGPIMVGRYDINGGWERALNNFHYNAWGGKYPPYDADDAVPRRYAERHKILRFEPGIVLEGGSIDTNGLGTVLTTKSVLLNPNRNPELSQDQIQSRLQDFLGHQQVIWLNEGLAGDDTDGHIDDISRFVSENRIMTMVCEDRSDINYHALAENLDILRSTQSPDGTHFDIHTLPLPQTRIEGTTVDGSEHVPASYANFYIGNGCVLVPIYDPRYDEQALSFFRSAFPDRKVYGIPCADLVWGQGSIHCVTMQLV
jgi:agmatine deiminase